MAKKAGKAADQGGPKSLSNRRARYDYELLQTFEAGIVLAGSEVKSLFHGRGNLADGYCKVQNTELWLVNLDIEPYEHSSHFQPDRRRERKLLLHKREIELIQRRSQEKGLTIVPTRIYFKNGKAKVEVALARGKREYDKREQIAGDEARREMERLRSQRF
jgi:SsrA-binding protein